MSHTRIVDSDVIEFSALAANRSPVSQNPQKLPRRIKARYDKDFDLMFFGVNGYVDEKADDIKPQEYVLATAGVLGHQFYVAEQFMYKKKPKPEDPKQEVKMCVYNEFSSCTSKQAYLRRLYIVALRGESPKHFELLRWLTKTYVDLDAIGEHLSEDGMIEEFLDAFAIVFKQTFPELDPIHKWAWTISSRGKKKSLHGVGVDESRYWDDRNNLKEFMRTVIAYVKENKTKYPSLFYIDDTGVEKCAIDGGVYSINRVMRMILCTKPFENGDQARPLLPYTPGNAGKPSVFIIDGEDIDSFVLRCERYIITLEPNEVTNLNPYPTVPEHNRATKRKLSKMGSYSIIRSTFSDNDRKSWPRYKWLPSPEEVKKIIENDTVLSGSMVVYDRKGSMFCLKNANTTEPRICIIKGEINESDGGYIVLRGTKLIFFCHDEGCREKNERGEYASAVIYDFANPPTDDSRSSKRRRIERENVDDTMRVENECTTAESATITTSDDKPMRFNHVKISCAEANKRRDRRAHAVWFEEFVRTVVKPDAFEMLTVFEKIPRPETWTVNFFRGPMKSGKSKGVREFMKENGLYESDRVVVWLSFRKTFTMEIVAALNTMGEVPRVFESYADIKGDISLKEHRHLVIQIESLTRLAEYADVLPKIDLLIMDEIESLLSQYNSPTVVDVVCVWDVAMLLAVMAERVVMFDAQPMERSLRFLNHVVNERRKLFAEKSETPAKDRVLVQYYEQSNVSDYTFYATGDKNLYNGELMEKLSDGKKIFAPSNSKKYVNAIEKTIKERVPHVSVGSYSADTPNKKDLANVNDNWSKYDFLAITPTVSAGVSYTVERYDAAFPYYVNMSAVADVCMQQSGRVRNLKDKIIVCYLQVDSDPRKTALPETVDELVRFIETSKSQRGVMFPTIRPF